MKVVPEFVDVIVSRVAHLFFLNAWHITVRSEDDPPRPSGHEDCDGLTAMNTDYFEARMYFDSGLEPTAEGFEVVIHEVLHLVFAPMRDAVHHIASFITLEEDRERLVAQYERVEEQLVTILARGLVQNVDIAAWLKDDTA